MVVFSLDIIALSMEKQLQIHVFLVHATTNISYFSLKYAVQSWRRDDVISLGYQLSYSQINIKLGV